MSSVWCATAPSTSPARTAAAQFSTNLRIWSSMLFSVIIVSLRLRLTCRQALQQVRDRRRLLVDHLVSTVCDDLARYVAPAMIPQTIESMSGCEGQVRNGTPS